jgi:hypothetical protein
MGTTEHTEQRSTGRQVALGAAVGGVAALAASLLAQGTARLVDRLSEPGVGANIGLGLLIIALEFTLTPLLILWGLHWFRLPYPRLIAGCSAVATLMVIFSLDPAPPMGIVNLTLGIAVYTGAATWLGGRASS